MTPRIAPHELCPNCGSPTYQKGARRPGLYCQPACKAAFTARTKTRGQRLTTLVQAWRLGRNTKSTAARATASEAFAEICRLADEWNAEDASAGRPKALKVVQRQTALGFRG